MRRKNLPSSRTGYTGYIPKRTDANQPEIVKTLRGLGFMVQSIHEVGKGVFDLCVAKHGLNIWCEVKDGSKPPSARGFTPAQKRWNFAWTGMRCVLTNTDDCLRFNEQVNAIGARLRAAGIALQVYGSKDPMYQPALH